MRKTQLRPTLTFQGKRNTINIGIDVIRLLGEPKYVCLLQSLEGDSVAITPCEPENNMSFEVPERFLVDRNSKFQIHSKQFVRTVLTSCGMDPDNTYVFAGENDAARNAVVFTLKRTAAES